MTDQDQAWDDLNSAVELYAQRTGHPGLTADWVLVVHTVNPLEDGTDQAATSSTSSRGQSHYRQLGLLGYAEELTRDEIRKSIRGE